MSAIRIDILTLFPEMISPFISESIIGRAKEAGYIDIRLHQLRDWSLDRRRRVDDTPYGGGKGMLIQAEPICRAAEDILSDAAPEQTKRIIYLSPKGRVLNQGVASELSKCDRLLLICGHYEGIDHRALLALNAEELSIGDYVLTGGELPACILTDCVCRLIPGVLAAEECFENESIACGMLEYPQYTRPPVFRGMEVPDVLLGGNHAEIEKWRFSAALEETRAKRPDLL